ncbi:MAG TPA: SgcJ/EcaC family oxidoreductase [Bryobacteraceae bacterium]|nr:SgcJ/EcaC family oxidoreductase [Bryobacteraceae bacterium]
MVRWLLLLCCFPLLAQDTEIRAILKNTEVAWNRGDLAAVAAYYADSPQTTFIGREVTRGGTQAILERYRRAYPTAAARGVLTFSEIEVRPLADGVALAIGKYSLKRTAAGGGDATGRFTLVLRRTGAGWKIIHDHSSAIQ